MGGYPYDTHRHRRPRRTLYEVREVTTDTTGRPLEVGQHVTIRGTRAVHVIAGVRKARPEPRP